MCQLSRYILTIPDKCQKSSRQPASERTHLFRVGVRSLFPSTEGFDHIDEPPDILNPPLGTAGLLFTSLNLGGLASNLSSPRKRTVDLSSLERHSHVNSLVLQESQRDLILKRGSGAEQVELLSVHSLEEGELGLEGLHVGSGDHIKHVGSFSAYNQLHLDFSCRSESSNKSL